MAITVADTDVLIDFLKARGEASAVEERLRRGTLRTTAVTRFELLAGARTQKDIGRILQLLEAIPCIPLGAEAADVAADIRRALETSGSGSGMADSLIAGITLHAGASLLTRNRKHFGRVPGLRLEE